MTHNIYEIIKRYLKHDKDDNIEESFRRWMLNENDIAEKDEALESLWNEFKSTGNSYSLPDSESIIDEAESTNGRRSNKRYRIALWISSAAAIIFGVLSCLFYFSNDKKDFLIASSEFSKASFVLPDGTEVWLNRNSTLKYDQSFDIHSRNVTIDGEGYFKVAKNPSKPFIVKANGISVTALGTQFTISAYEGKHPNVYLEEGRVRIEGDYFHGSTELTQDQSFTYNSEKGCYQKRFENISNHTSWTGNRLEFNDVPLSDIILNLSHWYNVDIAASEGTDISKIRLSFTVRDEPWNEIMNAIEILAKVKFSKEGNRYIIEH